MLKDKLTIFNMIKICSINIFNAKREVLLLMLIKRGDEIYGDQTHRSFDLSPTFGIFHFNNRPLTQAIISFQST